MKIGAPNPEAPQSTRRKQPARRRHAANKNEDPGSTGGSPVAAGNLPGAEEKGEHFGESPKWAGESPALPMNLLVEGGLPGSGDLGPCGGGETAGEDGDVWGSGA